jgi:hypothetical protein
MSFLLFDWLRHLGHQFWTEIYGGAVSVVRDEVYDETERWLLAS